MKSFETYREPLSYVDEPLAQDLLKQLVSDSNILPSAFYLQPTQHYIVQDAVVREKLWQAAFKQPLVRKAPAIIVTTANRFCAKQHEYCLDKELEVGNISVDEAQKARQGVQLYFDTSPLGIGWLGKLVGAPILRLFTTMPQLPAVHKREFLVRQGMKSAMTLFWQAHTLGLSPKIVDSFDEWKVKQALNISWHQIVVSIILVGRAKSEEKKRTSVTLEENIMI